MSRYKNVIDSLKQLNLVFNPFKDLGRIEEQGDVYLGYGVG